MTDQSAWAKGYAAAKEAARGEIEWLKKPPEITDEMIQAACVAGYGVDTDKDSNLYQLMKRALAAGLAAR